MCMCVPYTPTSDAQLPNTVGSKPGFSVFNSLPRALTAHIYCPSLPCHPASLSHIPLRTGVWMMKWLRGWLGLGFQCVSIRLFRTDRLKLVIVRKNLRLRIEVAERRGVVAGSGVLASRSGVEQLGVGPGGWRCGCEKYYALCAETETKSIIAILNAIPSHESNSVSSRRAGVCIALRSQ